MKRVLAAAMVCAAALAGAGPASAVDIHNLDDQDYDVVIVNTGDGTSVTFTLDSGNVEEDVCSACMITIDGVGTIDAQGDETIEISGGKFSKRSG